MVLVVRHMIAMHWTACMLNSPFVESVDRALLAASYACIALEFVWAEATARSSEDVLP